MAQETLSWLNQDLTQGILRRYEADNSIEVIDMFTKPATSKGDNYTSDMIRIFLEISRIRGGQKVSEKKTIIFKLAPIAEGPRKELIEKTNIFEVEIIMMTDTLKKMNALFGKKHRFNAAILAVQSEFPAYLVFEDLAPLGYRMADRHSGLDLKHSLLAIQNIARFHASSVAVIEKEPSQKDHYYRGLFNHENSEELAVFFVHGTNMLADEVETWPELGKRYADKIRGVATHMLERGLKSTKRNDDEFNVINHGDAWVNNMLFRYNDQGEAIDHIFVDFQLCIYCSPAIDLHYFLHTSPSMTVHEENSQYLLQEYLKTLTSTMKQLNCKTPPPTMEELQKHMKKRAFYAMLASFTVLPIVLADKKDAKDIDEMMKDGQFNNPGYKGQHYRKVMLKRIPEFDEMGLFDC